jgi:high-affinity iron transporter
MYQAFVITLREGLEAFLIVAVSLAYLRRTGRDQLVPAVHWGVVAALILSQAAAYLMFQATNREWLGGPLALIAAVSVTWMIVHMWRASRTMKGQIEQRLEATIGRSGWTAFAGVFVFTVLMVTREGMETALLLLQIRQMMNLFIGAALGVVAAAGLAWLWSVYGRRVNLGLFFQVTAIFLLVFVVQLTIRGVHEMSEQGYLGPSSNAIHVATESWGPESPIGHWLTYLTVLLPAGWLLIQALFARRPVLLPAGPASPKAGQPAQAAR